MNLKADKSKLPLLPKRKNTKRQVMLIFLFMYFQPAPNIALANPESNGKGPEGKDRNSSKKLKVCSGGKAGDNGKVTSGSGNDGATQRSDYESYFCKFFIMDHSCI